MRPFAVFLRIGEHGIVRPHLIDDVLHLGINGGIDLQAARGNHIAGHQFGIALLLHQILGYVFDDRIGKIRINITDILLILLIRTIDQLGCDRLVIRGLIDHPKLQHFAENILLPLLDLFRMVIRVIDRRIVGQARQRSALRQAQLGYILAEIGGRGGFYAIAVVAKVNRIEIHLQNTILVPDLILQRERAENLVDLTLDRIIVLIGDVLNELLGDGRTAVLVIAHQPVDNRTERALPVHAVVLVEAFVLDGHDRVFQILRDILAVLPNAVFHAADGFIQRFLSRFGINRIDKRVQIQAKTLAQIGCCFLRGWIDVCMYIIRKRNAAEAGAKHTDKQQRQQHAGYHMQDARSFSFASCQFGFLLARRN